MMIRKLQEHFPARTPEWANSLTLFAWGTYILWHPGMFSAEYFSGLYAMGLHWSSSPERFWGWLTVTVGLVRACALFVNGAYSRTPMVRMLAGLVSAFIWTQVILGVMASGKPALGIVMYASALLLDMISAYRASCDLVIADAARKAARRDALRDRGVNGFASSARSGIGTPRATN
jgi:hypothetical protein